MLFIDFVQTMTELGIGCCKSNRLPIVTLVWFYLSPLLIFCPIKLMFILCSTYKGGSVHLCTVLNITSAN